MKPGSLVERLGAPPNALGIIIGEYKEYDTRGEPWAFGDNDKPYRLWEVLCDNEIVVESERFLELVE